MRISLGVKVVDISGQSGELEDGLFDRGSRRFAISMLEPTTELDDTNTNGKE